MTILYLDNTAYTEYDKKFTIKSKKKIFRSKEKL